MYAARAAAKLKDRAALEKLARDDDDNVSEAAVDGLRKLAGHDADAIYVARLSRDRQSDAARGGRWRSRARRIADAAVPALEAACAAAGRGRARQLARRARRDREDARAARRAGRRQATRQSPHAAQNDLNADDLRRLAAPRARITIRGVGTFELALFTAQAPATRAALRAPRRVRLLQRPDVPPRRAELRDPGRQPRRQRIHRRRRASCATRSGQWPHVRGAVGISTRGRDTGDAQIFIDLVDNPRLDHDYTVFAQVLNGIDVVDRILEGDVIERIEIIP